jgi:hypothetical protein
LLRPQPPALLWIAFAGAIEHHLLDPRRKCNGEAAASDEPSTHMELAAEFRHSPERHRPPAGSLLDDSVNAATLIRVELYFSSRNKKNKGRINLSACIAGLPLSSNYYELL